MQQVFKDIMYMSQNKLSLPRKVGIAIELSINQKKLLSKKIKLTKEQQGLLRARQLQLLRDRTRC